jgi:hypothetical protein
MDSSGSSRARAGDSPSPAFDSSSTCATPPLALGSVPPSLLLPAHAPALTVSLLAVSPVASVVLVTAGASGAGVPGADAAPPSSASTTAAPCNPDGAAPEPAAAPAPWTAGVPRLSPGARFLDSILSMFHSSVASSISGSCSFVRFWVTPASLSPRINKVTNTALLMP